MTKARKNLLGHKFGMLSVLRDMPPPERVRSSARVVRNRYVLCECECGRRTSVRVDHLRRGKTRSCGCMAREILFAKQLAGVVGDDLHAAADAQKYREEAAQKSATLGAAAVEVARVIDREHATLPRQTQVEKLYDLPAGGYAELLAEQGGVCAICGVAPVLSPLQVDHDHASGRVRGLLCQPCNHGLGFFKDNLMYLARAMKYLSEAW